MIFSEEKDFLENRLTELSIRNSKRSLIVSGPQGCGKTTNAEKICSKYRLTRVVDNWSRENFKSFTSQGTLYLTNLTRKELGLLPEIEKNHFVEFKDLKL